MISAHPKNLSQFGSIPQIGMKIWNVLKPPPRIHRKFGGWFRCKKNNGSNQPPTNHLNDLCISVVVVAPTCESRTTRSSWDSQLPPWNNSSRRPRHWDRPRSIFEASPSKNRDQTNPTCWYRHQLDVDYKCHVCLASTSLHVCFLQHLAIPIAPVYINKAPSDQR